MGSDDHGFVPMRGLPPDDIQQNVKNALDKLFKALGVSKKTYVSFIVNGVNPAVTHTVTLPPIQDPVTGHILKRAKPGFLVVAAWNLTDLTDAQLSFAQSVVKFDELTQLSNTNLSAKRIGFVLVSN